MTWQGRQQAGGCGEDEAGEMRRNKEREQKKHGCVSFVL